MPYPALGRASAAPSFDGYAGIHVTAVDNVQRRALTVQHGEMRYPQELPDHLATTSFRWQEGVDAGLSVKQLRNSQLDRPSRGVRMPRSVPLSPADEVRALSWVTSGSAISHATAAVIWEFPLPHWVEELTLERGSS